MINLDLEKQITAQIEQTIRDYIVSSTLQDQIKQQVDAAVSNIIDRVANKVYVDVVNQNDLMTDITKLIQKETSQTINTQSIALIKGQLEAIPVRRIIDDLVKKEVKVTFDTVTFPEASINSSSIKWELGIINGSYIKGGRIDKFRSLGIDDSATDYQLKILDGHVVVETELSVPVMNVTETLNVNNLSILGTLEIGTEIIDHGPFSQLMQMHGQMVVDEALEPYKPLLKDGKALIEAGTLASSVVYSNLRKLGNLQELNVLGDAKFSETMFVSAAGKVGINTDEPRGALTIRDEEAEITFARTRRHTMFVGSTRDSEIEFGTNNKSQLVLRENQIDINTAIRIMGIKFSVVTQVPEHEGETNEIVMMSNARDQQPLFYICRGGNKWQSLR